MQRTPQPPRCNFHLPLVPLLLLLLNPALGMAQRSDKIEILREIDLPLRIREVFDVRWAEYDSVFLGSAKRGCILFGFDSKEGEPQVIIPPGAGSSNWGYSLLGLSPDYFVAGASAYFIIWQDRHQGAIQSEYFEVVGDLDVLGDRVGVVGARKDEKQRFSPDGAIAWIGSLRRKLDDLKPVYFSRAGPGARSMDACGPFGLAKIRFLQNGSLLLLPGVEPGVFLYNAVGELEHTWRSNELGIDAECELSDEEMYHLSSNLEARAAWINSRRTVDEVLPLHGVPGLIIRRTSEMTTHWQLKMLGPDGDVAVHELPFVGPSPHWHLRADIQPERIVFLLVEYDLKSTSPSRLIVTSVPSKDRKADGES